MTVVTKRSVFYSCTCCHTYTSLTTPSYTVSRVAAVRVALTWVAAVSLQSPTLSMVAWRATRRKELWLIRALMPFFTGVVLILLAGMNCWIVCTASMCFSLVPVGPSPSKMYF